MPGPSLCAWLCVYVGAPMIADKALWFKDSLLEETSSSMQAAVYESRKGGPPLWHATGVCLLGGRGPGCVRHVEEAEGDGIIIGRLPLHAAIVHCPGVDAGWRPRLQPAEPEPMRIQSLCQSSCMGESASCPAINCSPAISCAGLYVGA